MSQISKKISISQGLKFVERLTRLVNEEQGSLVKLGQAVTISFNAERIKVSEREAAFDEKLVLVNGLYEALHTLRSTIGAKNSEIGLHAMLAKQAVLRNQKVGLESLLYTLQTQNSAIDLSLVDEAFTRLERKEELPRVQVKVVSSDKIEALANQIRDIDRQIMVINDEVHRLNGATQFQLQLTKDVAEQIGLFA